MFSWGSELPKSHSVTSARTIRRLHQIGSNTTYLLRHDVRIAFVEFVNLPNLKVVEQDGDRDAGVAEANGTAHPARVLP